MICHAHQLAAVNAPRGDRQLGRVLKEGRHRRLRLWRYCRTKARGKTLPLSFNLFVSKHDYRVPTVIQQWVGIRGRGLSNPPPRAPKELSLEKATMRESERGLVGVHEFQNELLPDRLVAPLEPRSAHHC